MALPVGRKVLLDTNVLIDFLRAGLHTDWLLGRDARIIRFVSAVVFLELRLGADSPKRNKAVDKIEKAFPPGRVLVPTPPLFDQAGRLFRSLHGDGSGLEDRLGPINDLLIALSARQIGAAVVTSNVLDYRRIAAKLPGLRVIAPASN